MRYISHLDLLRLFGRACRRAELPIEISKGFTPRMRISIEPALKLGVESDALYAKFKLREEIEKEEFSNRLQAQMPEGIELLECIKRS